MNNTEKKPHRWAEVIKAWADGVDIQYLDASAGWLTLGFDDINWSADVEFRVKPEKVFPETSLTDEQLLHLWYLHDASVSGSAKDIADAAIKHFITSGEMEKWLEENK